MEDAPHPFVSSGDGHDGGRGSADEIVHVYSTTKGTPIYGPYPQYGFGCVAYCLSVSFSRVVRTPPPPSRRVPLETKGWGVCPVSPPNPTVSSAESRANGTGSRPIRPIRSIPFGVDSRPPASPVLLTIPTSLHPVIYWRPVGPVSVLTVGSDSRSSSWLVPSSSTRTRFDPVTRPGTTSRAVGPGPVRLETLLPSPRTPSAHRLGAEPAPNRRLTEHRQIPAGDSHTLSSLARA